MVVECKRPAKAFADKWPRGVVSGMGCSDYVRSGSAIRAGGLTRFVPERAGAAVGPVEMRPSDRR